ncbi:dihydrolipoyllysine-residue acetyltransferase [Thalassotalea piscium]|uniref:Dihydrolipoamide acetyltransferase component of pyruvate dehydrogenase complex n=1 Tax=Thalassotalea piscium TaxID=1230533 RepID=A0A7X0TU72_9GAMM|nr:dihydrolipoyllysine-residue acetyltransferase [Thalassotalea piscium]MBB6544052.1 2-oxoisovalerate dehydrogenase E2 component (dihydrolipoyl transacylase) [Thalassotalea piscium]
MSIDFILPDIGEGIVECELVEWLVNEGDIIVEDQPVADVMTDKALVQIPAMHSGVVDKLYYAKGDIAKVHQPLFAMTPSDGAANDTVAVQSSSSTTEAANEVSAELTPQTSTETIVEDFILPDIGEGIVECEVVEWLVTEGDVIVEDQPVADVMTDKALVQIPAMYSGKVVKLHYAKGDIAKVHAPLFAIERIGVSTHTKAVNNTQVPEQKAKVPEQAMAKSAPVSNEKTLNTKALASPAVRRVAREMNVNIHQVPGSGKKGRVYKDDVVAFINGNTQGSAKQSDATGSSVNSIVAGGKRVEAIRGVKAAMAKAMVNSVSTIPHFTYCEEIDMTKLIKLRLELKEIYAKQDIKLTMMPFFMKAMSLALKEFPIVNSQVNEDCTELTYFDDHNIGMAVDSKVGLLVPNIKQVQTKSILDLAQDITKLTNDARSGRVASADLKGGTISISNIGAIGGTVATPIINKPEAAIVALGKLQTLPRFNENGEVEARSIMQVSWSGDHRIIDGGTIARFSNLWKSFLEEPTNMLVHMA